MRPALLLLLLAPLALNRAVGQDYFLHPDGDDRAAGTSATRPWCSIARLHEAVLAPGDRVLLAGGQIFEAGTGVGAEMALQNPGFEDGLTHWEQWGGCSVGTDGVHAGGTSLAFAAGGCGLAVTGWRPGRAYVFSAWLRPGSEVRALMGITLKDADGSTIAERSVYSGVPEAWTEYHVAIAVPPETATCMIWFWNGSASACLADSVRVRPLLQTIAAVRSGTPVRPIVYGTYGSGRATIRSGDAPGFLAVNAAGIEIQDLDFVGSGAPAADGSGTWTSTGAGIACVSGVARLQHLRVRRCSTSGYLQGLLLEGRDKDSGYSDVIIEGSSGNDNRISGLAIAGGSGGADDPLSLRSHVGITIRHSRFDRNRGWKEWTWSGAVTGNGVFITDAHQVLVERCVASGNGTLNAARDGGPVGMWAAHVDGLVLRRCLSYRNSCGTGPYDGGGFDLDGACTNALVEHCYSYLNDGPGYLIAEYGGALPLRDVTFRYNVSWCDSRRTGQGSGFNFWCASSRPSDCQRILVHNNTIYADAGPAVTYQSGAMDQIRLHNNVFVVGGGQPLVWIPNPSAFTLQGNAYWAADGDYAGGWRWGPDRYASLAEWRSAAGSPETLAGAPLGLQTDPRIEALVEGRQPTTIHDMLAMPAFRLAAASPLVDSGTDLRTPAFGSLDVGSTDFFGNAVPAGAGFDIGAHEAPATARP